jgi:hypothetical protein
MAGPLHPFGVPLPLRGRNRSAQPQSSPFGGGGPRSGGGGCRALLLAAFVATPAFADVVSPAADAVGVTVYRDRPATAQSLREQSDDTAGLAMIAETRTVDLPAGRTRLEFQGVADAIIPASAAVTGLPGRLVERNFDYDLLDPGSLIERSVGQGVRIRRTNPKTGQVTEEAATLQSGPDGVTVTTSRGVEALGCGAGPQALVFDHLPAGLSAKPTLSVVADAPRAGRYKLTLSYLTVQIDWSADYVARLSADGTTLDLTGWLTLSNRSGMSFAGAPTAVVAGKLARVAPDLPDIAPRTVERECWPMGTTSDFARPPPPPPAPPAGLAANLDAAAPMEKAATSVSEMVVAATRRVDATTLGDYKLYSLVEPTTLAARQTKQIRFLHQTGVKFEKLYVFRAGDWDSPDADASAPAEVILRFHNRTAEGLGVPLPAGNVSMRQPQALGGGRELFLGEHGVRDVPVNEEFELPAGSASDVQVQGRHVSSTSHGDIERDALAYTLANARPEAVAFELRLRPEGEDFRIVAESSGHILKNGDDVWRLTIPSNGSANLSFTIAHR